MGSPARQLPLPISQGWYMQGLNTRRPLVDRIFFLIRPCISVLVSYSVVLTSTAAAGFPTAERSSVATERLSRLFRDAPANSGATGNAASAKLPVTIAAAPEGRAQYSWRVRETIYVVGRTFSASSGSRDLQSGFREGCIKQNWLDDLLAEHHSERGEPYL